MESSEVDDVEATSVEAARVRVDGAVFVHFGALFCLFCVKEVGKIV